MLGSVTYLVILAMSVAGLLGSPLTVAAIGASILAAISLFEHRRYMQRFAAVQMSDVITTFALSNVAVSIVSSVAAFALGAALRFVAGVS